MSSAALSEPQVLAHAKRRLFPEDDQSGTYAVVDTQFAGGEWLAGQAIDEAVRETLAPFNHVRVGSGYPDLVGVRTLESELLAVERLGDDPPLVAVESGSMEPHIHTGDMVFVMTEGRFPGPDARHGGVTTRQAESYEQFAGDGDVIVFEPNGNEQRTPIIHRSMLWVDAGENWYDRANREYVGNADCAVVPSLSEGFGFTAAEACALGIPVVATTAGSLPEVVSGEHVLVEPADPRSLADGVVRVACGEADYRDPVDFRWEDAVDKYLATYRLLVD